MIKSGLMTYDIYGNNILFDGLNFVLLGPVFVKRSISSDNVIHAGRVVDVRIHPANKVVIISAGKIGDMIKNNFTVDYSQRKISWNSFTMPILDIRDDEPAFVLGVAKK